MDTAVMYMYVIAHTNAEDCYIAVHTIRMYCEQASWHTAVFLYDDKLSKEIPTDDWKEIYDSFYHEDNWDVSSPERVLVEVKETKDYRKYYGVRGELLHEEKKQ